MSFLNRVPVSASIKRYTRTIYTVVENLKEYSEKKSRFNLSPDKVTVLQFSASWCGPCRMIKPEVQAMSRKYQDVDFLYINIDEFEDLMEEHSVSTVPTFIFLKGGSQVGRIEGAQKDKIESQLKSALLQTN